MIPAAKDKISSLIEVTEESFQGIGEGFKHGATIFTGIGTETSKSATSAAEEKMQNIANEIPRAAQDIIHNTKSAGETLNKTIDDTKREVIHEKNS